MTSFDDIYQNAFRCNLCHARVILHKRKNTEYNNEWVCYTPWRFIELTFRALLDKVQLCEHVNQSLEAFVAVSRLYAKFRCPEARQNFSLLSERGSGTWKTYMDTISPECHKPHTWATEPERKQLWNLINSLWYNAALRLYPVHREQVLSLALLWRELGFQDCYVTFQDCCVTFRWQETCKAEQESRVYGRLNNYYN